MTPDRFAKVRELFEVVVDLPDTDREDALRAETDDQAIIGEVLALCRSTDKGSTTQFSRPLNAMLKGATAPKLKDGDMLGVWKIGREIGQGGMGSVFLVERSDGHFTQTAALKFVKGLPRTDTLAYFSRERQLLATLSHPNIARLLDGGATQDGQPYLVMEYVDGVAIDEYCRAQKLDTAQILKLFSTACDAVAFAHRQLIVHCDLKPSNLMINRDGRPILLDFGIARMINRVGAHGDDAATGSSVASSVASSIAYTPRYASPEQRAHGVVTTASDIYSLGIMLGELLGEDISPELTAILVKATAPDPAKRYATVDAFTGDLERFVKKLPLQAVPPTAAYLTGKFLQRRWPLVLAGAAFAATVVGFTVRVVNESERAQSAEKGALTERDRAQTAEQQAVKERDATQAARAEALRERDGAARERDRATDAEQIAGKQRNLARIAEKSALSERDRAKAAEQSAALAEASTRQTNQFLVSIFDSGNPNAESGDIPVSKLITAAEARLDAELSGQPATQAELYSALAQVQFNMGRNRESTVNFKRAIELERKQQRPLVLAQMLSRQAYADLYALGGKEALALAREALDLRERHAAPDSEDVAESLAVLGTALFVTKGEMQESGEALRRSLAIREKRAPTGAGTAQSLWYLASHAEKDGRFEEAIALNRRALAIREKLFGAEHPACLDVRDTLAWALNRARRFPEAEALTRSTLAVRERLHGRQSQPVLRNMVILGSVLGAMGRRHEQLKVNEDALAVAEKMLGRESNLYANLLNNIAIGQAALGRVDVAVRQMEDVLPLARKIWSPVSRVTAAMETNLGVTLRKAGRLQESSTQLLKAYDVNLAVHGKAHADVAEALIELAMTYALADKLDEAARRLEQANGVIPLEKYPRTYATYLQATAMTAAKQGRQADSLGAYRRAEQILADLYGENDVRSALALLYRADLLARGTVAEERAQSREIAGRIAAVVSDKLAADAPVLLQIKQLQQP